MFWRGVDAVLTAGRRKHPSGLKEGMGLLFYGEKGGAHRSLERGIRLFG